MFTSRSGKIRLYDGAATPYYLELKFDVGDFNGPRGLATYDEVIVLDRGKPTSDMYHRLGPAAKIFEPLTISFSALITHLASTGHLDDWILALNDGGTTQVNSITLTTTKGTSTRAGITCPAFADSNKLACDIEIFWDESGVDYGLKYQECWLPLDQTPITESEENVTAAFSFLCYGAVSKITSFTSGSDITGA